MDTAPDFEALRAERNRRVMEHIHKMADEFDVPPSSLRSRGACYCACASGGPCEHEWAGEGVEFEHGWSATCSRCGETAMSHDMRVMP